jgi:hypothetical protein
MGDWLGGAKMRLYLHIHLPGERGKGPLGLPPAGPRRIEPAVHVGHLVGQSLEVAAPAQAPDASEPRPAFVFDALEVGLQACDISDRPVAVAREIAEFYVQLRGCLEMLTREAGLLPGALGMLILSLRRCQCDHGRGGLLPELPHVPAQPSEPARVHDVPLGLAIGGRVETGKLAFGLFEAGHVRVAA